MAAIELKTFQDIYEAVAEEIGIAQNNTTAINRIKRNVNMIYLNKVMSASNWPWLLERVDIVHEQEYNTDGSDTASLTKDSTTVTLSSAIPSSEGSKAGFFFTDLDEGTYYTIESHTAGSDTLTLSSEYVGETNSAKNFRIWTNKVSLPKDAAKVIDISHDESSRTVIPIGPRRLTEFSQTDFLRSSAPRYFATDAFENGSTEADRNRFTRIWPSRNDEDLTLHITYKKEVTALDADSDEPVIPIEDRIVLFYGAVALSWKRETDSDDFTASYQLFQDELNDMVARWEDGTDMPRLEMDDQYTRFRRRAVGRGYWIGEG